ncbi:hypothetical protein ABTZ99_13840 [Actinosynnema sp. NPDC002837]
MLFTGHESTVGDCVELADTQRRVHVRGGQKKVDFCLRLRALGIFPEDAPHAVRAFGLAAGRLSIEELVDRYPLRCGPVRDLIVDYLRERQPSLDFASIDAISRTLAGLFWARIEALAPGIDTLRLPPETMRAWKEDLSTKKRITTNAAGEQIEISSPRINAKDELLRVRAFYLDIAHWAPWAVSCPISDAEIGRAKELKHRKARMDQRTRERLPVLPVLPVLARTAHERRLAAERRLRAAQDTRPGPPIPGTDGALRRAIAPTSIGRHVWAEDTTTGKRRNLSFEDEESFWSFFTIEVLRLTGIRCEEMLELSHHSITEYRLPSTGELVPLLQIAPSKTDTERLLLVSPELGPRPIQNGTPSSHTSKNRRCPSGSAREHSDRLASMSMLASDFHYHGLTRRNDHGWRRSVTIWRPVLSRPNAKDGSGRSKDRKSA